MCEVGNFFSMHASINKYQMSEKGDSELLNIKSETVLMCFIIIITSSALKTLIDQKDNFEK